MNALIILALTATASNTTIPQYTDLETSVYSEMPAIATIAPHGLICPRKGIKQDDEGYMQTNISFPYFKDGCWHYANGSVINGWGQLVVAAPKPKTSAIVKAQHYLQGVAANLATADGGYGGGIAPTSVYVNGRFQGMMNQANSGAPLTFNGIHY